MGLPANAKAMLVQFRVVPDAHAQPNASVVLQQPMQS